MKLWRLATNLRIMSSINFRDSFPCLGIVPPSISAARFLDIGSDVSIFWSFASRSDFRTESLLFPPCIQSPILFPLFPLPSPLSLLARQFPYPSLPSSLCLSFSLFSLSSSHEDNSHPLALFFSLAQCASENMNPSSHCLRQRFSNFPPLCANDEGTKGEIKSRPQWVWEEASRRQWQWP